jgi:hypothetical protein
VPRRFCNDQCRKHNNKLKNAKGWTGPQTAAYFKRRMDAYSKAIEAFCQACEPDGFCKTADCPLRDVSPLEYRPGREPLTMATPAPQVMRRIHAKMIRR